MPQYLLSVYYREGQAQPGPDEMQKAYRQVSELNDTMQAEGAWVFGGGLETPDTSTVVRAEGDQIVTTDGPFPESKEQIGGFWIIKAPDLDAALEWARKATVACMGPVEVRPFQDEPDA